MTAPALFSGHFFSALGWALFHFLWQGALVAGIVLGLGSLLANRPPAVRYALACAGLATMLALPIATAWSLAAVDRAGASASVVRASADSAAFSGLSGSRRAIAKGFFSTTIAGRVEAARPWALSVWFAGVLALSLRFLGGLSTANRLTRRGARPAAALWQEILSRFAARLRITRPVRLLESALVEVPTAIGVFRPVILLPASVFTGLPTRGLEALIAHELAHIRRHDYLVNLLQAVAETLLFYHPAVWWVSGRIRAEREHCCDDLAIAATGDARSYARALVRLEEMRGAAPALAVAAGGQNLWKRVVRLLRDAPATAERPSAWLAGAVALILLFVLGAAARVGPSDSGEPEVIGSGSGSGSFVSVAEPGPADAVVSAPAAPAKRTARELKRGSPSGRRVLTAEQRDAFRDHGVTADFVHAVAALGYDRAEPEDILALEIHGVTPEDISEMNGIFGKRSLDEHVAFKIHGVTPESVRRLSAFGLGKLSPDDVLAMKIHGVDAAFVESLRAAGYEHLSADDAVSARIHGVEPADAAAWTRLGYPHPSLEDLVSARIHGVTPEFGAGIRAAGITADSLDDLVAFRIHGVTAEFLRELKAQGLKDLSEDDAVSFRIHGVTPELVKDVRSLGYTNPSPDDLVALRIHGVSMESIRKANARAGRRLPLDEIVDRSLCGKDGDDDE
jgi:beta-lactamase regulating signal transducer with metallopeptidase domain